MLNYTRTVYLYKIKYGHGTITPLYIPNTILIIVQRTHIYDDDGNKHIRVKVFGNIHEFL